ncbi:phage portal protein [Tissierella praeacuta]|uniref:phage portal protein n=1 Tax=Tissierella praeacuta TaxID=43131 RepID=UPI003516EE54
MSLEKYILDKYDGKYDWFVEEVALYWHTNRILRALDNKEYLAGKHKIKKRVDEVYNGKKFVTRKIGLQYAKTLLEFETAFLLKKPYTMTSNDLKALEHYKAVYREGKYNKLDYKILSNMVKYGEVYEYLWIDENKRIKSILFNAEDSYPIYDHTGDMIGFIHHYIFDNVAYYTIYSENTVEEYSDAGGSLHLLGSYTNISGLPIAYVLPSEEDELIGQASLNEYIDILDNMEDLLSKYMDSFYKFLNPIPVVNGTKLNAKEGGIDESVVGFALQLMDDAEFSFVSAKMDVNSFKELWKTLKQSLLDISMTPGVSMNSQEISNISTVSIQMLYGMAEIKGSMNSLYLKEGLEQRWGKMKSLLRRLGYDIEEDAYIDCQFNMNIPQNAKEIVENISQLTGNKQVMSLERAIEVNPYTLDVNAELERLEGLIEGTTDIDNDVNVNED